MALPPKTTQGVAALTDALRGLLPGTPHPYADQAISFAGVASDLRLTAFWTGGSKTPAISGLLAGTLEHRPQDFTKLLVLIVNRGLVYRSNRSAPITRGEMRGINQLILALGFKVPELVDPAFIESLARDVSDAVVPSARPAILPLIGEFSELMKLEPTPRGYAFEVFLNRLFAAYSLDPREPFRLAGEQIDGSFQLNDDTYLVEARWRNDPADQAALAALSVKVSGKAQWSRGLFVSYSGFTAPGLEAFRTGKPTNIVCMDGLDIRVLLAAEGVIDLSDAIRRKARRAAETNEAFAPVVDLYPS